MIIFGACFGFLCAIEASAQNADIDNTGFPRRLNANSITPIRNAYRSGSHIQAIVLSERALFELGSGSTRLRAEIYFWKGASLAGLERYAEALVALDSAGALGFRPPELYLERAVVLRALGRQDEAEQSFQEAERLSQDDPDRLEQLRKQWGKQPVEEQSFQLRVYPTIGYDSNILSIDENEIVLLEDADDSSFYFGFLLAARYRLYESKLMTVLLDYQNNVRGYANESDLSVSDNLLAGTMSTRIGSLDWLLFELRGFFGETFLKDDGHFRTLRGIAPAFLLQPADDLRVRLWVEGVDLDYYEEDAPAPQDRDGVVLKGGLRVSWEIGDGWTTEPYVTFLDYDAEGTDWEQQTWELGLSTTTPEFIGFQFTLTVAHAWANFDEDHSLSGFTKRRKDRRFLLRLTVVFRQLEELIGAAPAVSFTYQNWSSNIDAFDFDRFDIGFNVDVLALTF